MTGMTSTPVVAVLCSEAPSLEGLFEMLNRSIGGAAGGTATMEGDHVRLDLTAGVVRASTFGAPWPDEDEASLAELGGPGSGLYAGGLGRAGDQSAVWPGGELAARAHGGFVHLTVAEATGSPRAQIEELERLGVAMLSSPKALCIYFPAGESLRDGHVIGGIRHMAQEQDAIPLQIWMNGRVADVGMGMQVADVVGLGQIGQADSEAVFPEQDGLPAYEVLGFLFDVAHHLSAEGGALEDGVIYEGPGGLRWRAGFGATGQIPPARPVVRWIPLSPDEAEGTEEGAASPAGS